MSTNHYTMRESRISITLWGMAY